MPLSPRESQSSSKAKKTTTSSSKRRGPVIYRRTLSFPEEENDLLEELAHKEEFHEGTHFMTKVLKDLVYIRETGDWEGSYLCMLVGKYARQYYMEVLGGHYSEIMRVLAERPAGGGYYMAAPPTQQKQQPVKKNDDSYNPLANVDASLLTDEDD